MLAFQRWCPGSQSGDQLTLVYGALRTFTYVRRFTAALVWCGLTMTLKLQWKYDAVLGESARVCRIIIRDVSGEAYLQSDADIAAVTYVISIR